MKSRHTQIIFTLATIILVAGFVLVPSGARAVDSPSLSSYASDAVFSGLTGIGPTIANSPSLSSYASSVLFHGLTGIGPATSYIYGPIASGIITFVFNNILLSLANQALTLAGTLMNGVMSITLNMSQFVSSINIVDATWSIIRDLASIIIIFFLLYVSITMIIGLESPTIRHVLVMVVIAGILINFSLFFTKIFVDASNLVGLAFYRAISPSAANVNLSATGDNYLVDAFTGDGLSYQIMRSLKIQTSYNPLSSNSVWSTNTGSIIASSIGGLLIMGILAISFLGAAILFAVRVAILIMLMAFSPVYFIGLVVPKFKKEISDKWEESLINQCFVLPIYMLFMYVAVRVITSTSFQNTLNPPGTTGGTNLFSISEVGVVIEYIIVLVLINVPLFAAIKYAGAAGKWVDSTKKSVSKWAGSTIKNTAWGTAGIVGRNTVGAMASKISEGEGMRQFYANNPILGGIAKGGLSKLSSASYGGKKGGFDAQRKADEKARKGTFKDIGTVNRADYDTDEAFHEAEKRGVAMQGQYLDQLKNTPISQLLGADRSGYDLEGDYNANYGKVHKDDIQKIIDENSAEIEKIREETKTKRDAEIEEIGTKHKADFEEIDRALKSDLARLGSKYSDNTKEELENIKKSMSQDIENTKKSITTKWNSESKAREAPFQKKIDGQTKYRTAAQKAQRKKDLKDAIEETKDDAGKPEPKKEAKPSEPKP